MPYFSLALLIVWAFQALPTSAQDSNTQTITALAGYSALRPCAQSCIMHSCYGGAGWDALGHSLGCLDSEGCGTAAENTCYCNANLRAAATTYLSSCVKGQCTIGIWSSDFAAATSLYNSYCTFENAVQPTPATTAGSSASPASGASLSATSSPTQTSTGDGSGNTNIGGSGGGGGSGGSVTITNDNGNSGASRNDTGGKLPVFVAAVAGFLALIALLRL